MSDQNESREINVAIFTLGTTEYCIKVTNVLEFINLLEITPIPKLPDYVEGVINLRGQIAYVFDLRKYFGVEPIINKATKIIIVDYKGESIGIIVDSIAEVMPVLVDQIENMPFVEDMKIKEFIKGICKHDDRILVLLDLDSVLGKITVTET
jgi:purine-binding chemotaxis protein CheW